MALWLCRAGRHGEHEQKFLDEGRIYLTWGKLNCDLGKINERPKLMSLLEEVYPDRKKGHLIQNSGQIWIFAQSMTAKDWVCVPSKRKTIHIGEIVSKYHFDPSAENPYYHYHKVKWLETDIPRTNFDQDILNSLGAFTTVCQIKRNDAENRVRAMQKSDWKSTGITIKNSDINNGGATDEVETNFDIEQTARDQIARLIIARFNGHGLESLVEAILKAQGFTTYHSSKGPDGGVDLLAAPGTLGFDRPRICVQVKSQDKPLERPVLDQLVGTMQHVQADQGLLVCWGGFKPTIKKEEARLFFQVRLWNQSDLIENLLANYDKLDEDIKAEIPLKRMWAVTTQDSTEE